MAHPGVKATAMAIYLSYACTLVAFGWPRWSAGNGAQAGDRFGVVGAVLNGTRYSYLRDCHDASPLAAATDVHMAVCGKAVTAAIVAMSVTVVSGLAAIVFSSQVAAEKGNLVGRPAYLVFAAVGAGVSTIAQICATLLWIYVEQKLRDPLRAHLDVSLGAAFWLLVTAWLLALLATIGFFLVPPAGVDEQDMYAALASVGDGDAMFMGDAMYDYDEQLALDGDNASSQATEL